MPESPNFSFLGTDLASFAMLAERYVFDDPNTSLLKLRQFAELLARNVAARNGIATSQGEDFRTTIDILKDHRLIPREIRELLHWLRLRGNEANHEGKGDGQGALAALISAREVAVWFHRTFHEPEFSAGPFRPPARPENESAALRDELDELRQTAAREQQSRELAEGRSQQLAEIARKLDIEANDYRNSLRTMEFDSDKRVTQYEQQLQVLQEQAKNKAPDEIQSFIERGRVAARSIGGQATTLDVPLAQIRCVLKTKSQCCDAPQLLAQSSDGGFVKKYCSGAQCGNERTVSSNDFHDLDLWVACPTCKKRAEPTMVQSSRGYKNYGYRCQNCNWSCILATLLPHVDDLFIWVKN